MSIEEIWKEIISHPIGYFLIFISVIAFIVIWSNKSISGLFNDEAKKWLSVLPLVTTIIGIFVIVMDK